MHAWPRTLDAEADVSRTRPGSGGGLAGIHLGALDVPHQHRQVVGLAAGLTSHVALKPEGEGGGGDA